MSLQKFLPAAALSILALCRFSSANAQLVYVTKNPAEATVRVFVTTYRNDADVIVFKTPFAKNCVGNKGLWYFPKFSGEADKRIYLVDSKLTADLVVFYTPNSAEAGWKNKKKRFIMN